MLITRNQSPTAATTHAQNKSPIDDKTGYSSRKKVHFGYLYWYFTVDKPKGVFAPDNTPICRAGAGVSTSGRLSSGRLEKNRKETAELNHH